MPRPRSRLSVCCMTVDPPARVAAVLGLLRDVADEVVVAVDDRVDPSTLGPVHAVADRVLRFGFRPPVDRPRPWLAAQCTGEWILSIDGDEVPSRALVAALPELVASPDVQHHQVPHRWLFPDSGHWLADLPWWPDFHVRLVRNDATLAVRGGVHAGIVPVLPARHLDTPIYHLDALVRTEEERRAKADRYEAERPGHQAFGGGLLNDVLYLPERHGDVALRPVPDDDRAWIDDVLAATDDASSNPPPQPRAGSGFRGRVRNAVPVPVPVPVTPAAEIDAFVPPSQLPDDAYRVGLEPFETDHRIAPGELRPFYVRVRNEGSVTWPWGLEQEPQIRVSYHWRTVEGEMLHYEGLRSPLPDRVGPGGATIVPVWVQAPAEAGTYVLELDLVHEHVRWFEAPLQVEMKVAGREPADREIGARARC